MKQLLAVILVLALIAISFPASGSAYTSSPTSLPVLDIEDVRDLLALAPDAVTVDVDEVGNADELLRALSSITLHPVAVEEVDPALRDAAEKWNGIIDSGIATPGYAELRQTYDTHTEFQQAIEGSVVDFNNCVNVVVFIVTVIVPFWVLLLIPSFTLGCAWQLPGVSNWVACTTDGTSRFISAVFASVNWIMSECSPLAYEQQTVVSVPVGSR